MIVRLVPVLRPIFTAGIFLSASPAMADLVINFAETPVEISFEGTLLHVNDGEFRGEGFNQSPSFGQLDSDSWEISTGTATLPFGGSASPSTSPFANGDSSGNIVIAGIYSFDTGSGNRTLGVQPHHDHFTAGTITLRVLNSTGSDVSTWNVAYDIFAYNDTNFSTSVNFSFAVGMTSPGAFSSVPLLDFDSPTSQDDIVSWSGPAEKLATLAATVPAGANLFLRWTIDSTNAIGPAHVHDEIGLDNISVTASIPEPTAAMLCSAVSGFIALCLIWNRIVHKKTRSAID